MSLEKKSNYLEQLSDRAASTVNSTIPHISIGTKMMIAALMISCGGQKFQVGENTDGGANAGGNGVETTGGTENIGGRPYFGGTGGIEATGATGGIEETGGRDGNSGAGGNENLGGNETGGNAGTGGTGGSTGGAETGGSGGNSGGMETGGTGGTGGSTGGAETGGTGGSTGGAETGGTGGSTGGAETGGTGGSTGGAETGGTGGMAGAPNYTNRCDTNFNFGGQRPRVIDTSISGGGKYSACLRTADDYSDCVENETSSYTFSLAGHQGPATLAIVSDGSFSNDINLRVIAKNSNFEQTNLRYFDLLDENNLDLIVYNEQQDLSGSYYSEKYLDILQHHGSCHMAISPSSRIFPYAPPKDNLNTCAGSNPTFLPSGRDSVFTEPQGELAKPQKFRVFVPATPYFFYICDENLN
jgi:hypothetical protein